MNTKEYVEKYMEVWKEISSKFSSGFVSTEVMVNMTNKIFEEMLKDGRSAEIEKGKAMRFDRPATEAQKELMKRLGISFDNNITVKQASNLISQKRGVSNVNANDANTAAK